MEETKILVLNKPEKCGDCPFFDVDTASLGITVTICSLLGTIMSKDTKAKNCPLMDIKEVCKCTK